MNAINEYVRHAYKFPPRCIADLRPIRAVDLPPVADDCAFIAYFSISCPCGEKFVQLLGYNTKSESDLAEDIFVSPLATQCPSCHQISELLDTQKHGFDGEQGDSCTITGEGQREKYATSCCGQTTLELMPAFYYQNDERAETGEQRPQDFFDCFALYGRCCSCGSWQNITDYECA